MNFYYCIFQKYLNILLTIEDRDIPPLDVVESETHDLVAGRGGHLGGDVWEVVLGGELAHLQRHVMAGAGNTVWLTSPPMTLRPFRALRNLNSSLQVIPPASMKPTPGHSPGSSTSMSTLTMVGVSPELFFPNRSDEDDIHLFVPSLSWPPPPVQYQQTCPCRWWSSPALCPPPTRPDSWQSPGSPRGRPWSCPDSRHPSPSWAPCRACTVSK